MITVIPVTSTCGQVERNVTSKERAGGKLEVWVGLYSVLEHFYVQPNTLVAG